METIIIVDRDVALPRAICLYNQDQSARSNSLETHKNTYLVIGFYNFTLAPFPIMQTMMAMLLLAVTSVLAAQPVVHLGPATLIGRQTSIPQASAIANAYLGVPFAKPPQRFLPPERLEGFSGTHDVSEYKAACIQQGPRERQIHIQLTERRLTRHSIVPMGPQDSL